MAFKRSDAVAARDSRACLVSFFITNKLEIHQITLFICVGLQQ